MAKTDFTGITFLVDGFAETSNLTDAGTHVPDTTDPYANGYLSQPDIDLDATNDWIFPESGITSNPLLEYATPLRESDLYCEITGKVTGTGSSDFIGIYLVNSTNRGYAVFARGAGNIQTYRLDPGFTSLNNTPGGWTPTSETAIRLERKDNGVAVFVNDSLIYSTTDSTFNDATRLLLVVRDSAGNAGSFITSVEAKYDTYTFSTSASGTRTLKWNIRDIITGTRTLKWNMLEALTGTRTLKWNLFQTVSGTRTLFWNLVWLSVSGTRRLKWNIRSQIGGTRTLKWTMYQLLTGTRTLKWHIKIENITGYRTLKWQIQALNVLFTVAPVDSGTTVYYAIIDRLGTVLQDFTSADVFEMNPKTDLTIPSAVTLNEDFSAYGVVIQMSSGFQGFVVFLISYGGEYTTAYEQINGYINALPAIKEQIDKFQFTGNNFVFSAPQINSVSLDELNTALSGLPPDVVAELMANVMPSGYTFEQTSDLNLTVDAGDITDVAATRTATIAGVGSSNAQIETVTSADGKSRSVTITPHTP